ncbi:MAG TPA: RNA polymerase sigma factor [Gammaproteobacteria bacterium]|nr:RNA polymerase sigma factor [Gammaproteobacteria bacterium]
MAQGTAQQKAVPASTARGAHMRRLFEQHNRELVRFLTVKLHSEAEARDVAQEAYVRLLKLDEPDAVSFLRAYLFRVATNIAVDHLRRRAVRERNRPQEYVLFEQLLTRPGPERSALGKQHVAIVKRALEELPTKCQRALLLHVVEEKTPAEIGLVLKVSPRMVRNYLARSLAHCRMALDAAD